MSNVAKCSDCPDVIVNIYGAYECKLTGETLGEYLAKGGQPIMRGCPRKGESYRQTEIFTG